MAFTTLILDAPAPPLLFEELDQCLELGLAVTLNLHYFADKDSIKQHYGARIGYAEINCHDEPTFIAAVAQAGGYSVFKTRLNIPLGGGTDPCGGVTLPDHAASCHRPSRCRH